MKCFVLIPVFAVCLLGVFGAGAAGADPVNSQKAFVFPVTCAGQQLTVVSTAPNGPAHVLGSTSNLLAVSTTFTILRTGESQTHTLGQGLRTGLQGDLITCTNTIEDPQLGPIEVTVQAFVTPRGQ